MPRLPRGPYVYNTVYCSFLSILHIRRGANYKYMYNGVNIPRLNMTRQLSAVYSVQRGKIIAVTQGPTQGLISRVDMTPSQMLKGWLF
mgnify:FL=1|jgi:hypothetical protein